MFYLEMAANADRQERLTCDVFDNKDISRKNLSKDQKHK